MKEEYKTPRWNFDWINRLSIDDMIRYMEGVKHFNKGHEDQRKPNS